MPSRLSLPKPPLMKPILVLALALTLGACSGESRRALGITSEPPDAFAVVKRAPLELPPDYGLRPPQPGAARPTEAPVTAQAKSTLLGVATPQPKPDGNFSAGELALLKQANALGADTAVRDAVNKEAIAEAKASRSFVDKLIFWKKPEEPGSAVDADAEARRLRENAALGKPPTDGETPIIKRKTDRGILEGIF